MGDVNERSAKWMVGGLVEVVLRVKNIDAMQTFYSDVIGLPVWQRFCDDMVFLKLPARAGGRSQAIALFAERWPPNVPGQTWTGLDAAHSTIHHFALSIDLPHLKEAASLLAASGIASVERTFPWVGWRSLMLADPEGNVVELVANDPALLDPNGPTTR